jgi:MoaA/NifB/PqqE/SkfB family radical SAM enzyme
MNKDKNFQLTQSKSFCMLPWLHIHTTPVGRIMPCCVADMDIKANSLRHAFNSKEMKQLRLDMLSDVQNPACNACYSMDPYTETSRKHHNKLFAHRFDELVPQTNSDGSLNTFKLHYYDIRFSNICNMKCRMCNSDYSSQWAKETSSPISYGNDFYLVEILERIDDLELAYFAGGEPLITEQHYTILEQLIRKNKNIPLVYSTNASVLKYKNKDLLELWKHFSKIELRVSMDHYGNKAEYIRHGSKWDVVESNILKFKELDNVNLALLSVVNIYNYLTLPEIHKYILEKNLLKNTSNWILFKMNHPDHLTTLVLPKHLKEFANNHITNYVNSLGDEHSHVKSQLLSCITYTESDDQFDTHKEKFIEEVRKLDSLRNEDCTQTFPELASIFNG